MPASRSILVPECKTHAYAPGPTRANLSRAMHKSVIAEERISDTGLTKEELQRYSRHLIMPEVTAEGQKRLKAARVLCIGAGGLGSPAALYLAAAGAGRLGLVDFDRVDLTNLQRQILHGTKDIGRSKLESARDRLRDINPDIEIELHECRFSSENAQQIVAEYDVIIDGSDNFATRYLSNDVCVFAAKAECLRLRVSVRRSNHRVRAAFGWALLSLSVSGAASARVSPQLRASRCARRSAWHHRNASGD